MGITIFNQINQLAAAKNSLDLGQGFPTWQPPDFLTKALSEPLPDHIHQYSRPIGEPDLVKAIGDHYQQFFDKKLDPMGEVLTTPSATCSLTAVFNTFLQPGDEVIFFEPYFPFYIPQ